MRVLGFSGVGRLSRESGPCVDEKGDRLTCHGKNYPRLHRGAESWGLGPWAPSVFYGQSDEVAQS